MLISTSFIFAQASYNNSFNGLNLIDLYIDEALNSLEKENKNSNISIFTLSETSINTKYSEIVSGLFKGKVIIVSSKKIGGLGNGIDKNTNQPYTDLFCVDVMDNGELKRPLLFSRILNTKGNEGQVTFTKDESTMYFTRSTRENSKNYQLYKANLEANSVGKWINIEMLDISSENHSIENPFIHNNRLYFASNMNGTIGGFDLFVADINSDGTIGTPINLGPSINTVMDEKYPFISNNNKHLYFSSNGHNSIGGFDIFISRIAYNGFKIAKNLGKNVNTIFNEIAFFMKDDFQGYLSSDKIGGKGSFDIYKFDKDDIVQSLEGVAIDGKSKIALPNTLVVLFNEEGREIGRQFSDEKGQYKFPVTPFDAYIIETVKDGFADKTFSFEADNNAGFTHKKNLELDPTKAEIVEVSDKILIDIENIYFNFNKWNIKPESTLALNKIVDVLNANPEMKIEINAHTDNVGKRSYNQKLSEKRAASAMRYIINKGVNANRLVSHGFGESQPLIDCDKDCTKTQDQINRRIEFVIIK